jgi:hypothetical protein
MGKKEVLGGNFLGRLKDLWERWVKGRMAAKWVSQRCLAVGHGGKR